MSKKNKNNKKNKIKEQKEKEAKQSALMLFHQDGYYNDLTKPLYLKGNTYEIFGRDMINRWLKRGAEIVDKGDASEPEEQNIITPVEQLDSTLAEEAAQNSKPEDEQGNESQEEVEGGADSSQDENVDSDESSSENEQDEE